MPEAESNIAVPRREMTRNASVGEPKVSVVIPAYNAGWCVARAIASVLEQGIDEIEVIVVDDGSTDDTAAVVAGFGPPVRLVQKSNGGMSSARNAGIRETRGRFVAFLDSDDRWLPGKLLRQLDVLKAHPDVAFCAAVALLEDAEGQSVGTWGCGRADGDLVTIFANHSAVAGGASSVLARREAVLAAGGFDESLRGAEDTDFWIRLAAYGNFKCIPEPLVVVLRRRDSVSRNLDGMRAGSLAMTRKNRGLLPTRARGAFWREVYAGILCDYAKWEYREGRRAKAALHVLEALCRSPLRRGRLALSLLAGIARNESF